MGFRHILECTILAAILQVPAFGQLEWRVSVKFVYDNNGVAPGLDSSCSATNTEAEVDEKIEYANAVLAQYGRGYRFRVVEIENLNPPPLPPTGMKACSNGDEHGNSCDDNSDCPDGTCQFVTEWTSAPVGFYTRQVLDEEARENPIAYMYDEDALNIYVIDRCNSGYSQTRLADAVPGEDPDLVPVILMGQRHRGGVLRPFHEMGHSMGICHPHGCPSWCSDDGADCDANPVSLGDDCVDDTIPDAPCLDTVDELAMARFGIEYDNLSCTNKQAVLDVIFNVMSYHSDNDSSYPLDLNCPSDDFEIGCNDEIPVLCRHRLTQDQLDRMTDRSNCLWPTITNGLTWFVDKNNIGIDMNCAAVPVQSMVAGAVADADPGDVINIRAGSYDEPMTIVKPLTLRASRGVVHIGQ